jgi:hypothetical protein
LDTVIASQDIVCADAYATTLFGKQSKDVPYILACEALGLGTSDWGSVRLEEVTL